MKQLMNMWHSNPTSTAFNPKQRVFLGWLRILFGLLIYSFGVYFTIHANIGLTPWDCLAVGISNHTLLNYGGAMVGISLAAVVIQVILKERIGFATILDAVITGNLTQLLNSVRTRSLQS